jgi:O-antigen chain-terminating methyltransferase
MGPASAGPIGASGSVAPMTETSHVLRYLEEAAARADAGEDAAPPSQDEALRHTRNNLRVAAEHLHVGAAIPDDVRLRGVKQALVGTLRPITSHQQTFNTHLTGAVDGIAAVAEALGRSVAQQEQRTNRLQAAVATTDLTVDDVVTEVRALSGQVADLLAAVDTLGRQVGELEAQHPLAADVARTNADLAVLQARQNLIFREARAALPEGFTPDQLGELARELPTGYEQLYEDLEDTFRGTREHVRALVSEYLDDLAKVPGKGPVIDIGCGRGEWIEVLRDAEIDAYGIDLNQVVVDRCAARGLDVRHGDALAHLRSIPEGSVRAITSFHLVEHLSLDTLVGLIEAALLALQPGGIFIMETPNPSNLQVGASSFYLDPTHLKPLHPQFLQFLAVQRGFADAEVRFLHPEAGPRLRPEDLADHAADPARAQRLVDQINWALSGPLDYAVVAHKARSGR